MADSGRHVSTLGIVLGIGLIAVGVGAYVLSEFESVTALIPAIFGVVIALLGVVGRQTTRERLAVYGIGLLALLGVLGSAQGISDLIALLTGEPVDSAIAPIAQSTTVVIGLVLLGAVGKYVLDTR